MSGADKPAREHSNAFKKFVPDYKERKKVRMDDIVAYFFYKRRKINYLDEYNDIHGTIPDEAFNQYQRNALTDDKIAEAQREADEFMDEFIHSVRIEGIKEAIKKPFWAEVWFRIKVNLVTAALLLLIYLLLTFTNNGFPAIKEVIRKLLCD